MTNKRKIFQKTLALAKSKIEEKKIEKTKETELETQILKQSQTKIDNQNKEIKSMFTKQQKHEIASLQILAESFAKSNKTSTNHEFKKLYDAWKVETKAAELTTDHDDALNKVRASDIRISFDPTSASGQLLARFSRENMRGQNSKTVLYDGNDAKLQSLGEVEELVEQTFEETPKTITVKRVGMMFKISRSLQEESVVDMIRYLNERISTKVATGLVDGILNGKSGTSADADIAAKDIKNHMAGVRATLKDASQTHPFAAAALSAANVATFLAAAGPKFNQSPEGWVLLAGPREAAALSALVRADGPTGQTAISQDSLKATKIYGVELVETYLFKSIAASGSGYDADGFVGSTAADNDHGILVLMNPKAVSYAYEAERVDAEYEPKNDSIEVTLNSLAGWIFINTARDKNGLMGVNIGPDIP